MAVAIRVLAANQHRVPQGGVWLVSADVDAFDGRGDVAFSTDPAEAMTFASIREAMAFWKQPSTVRPYRPDGKPNRPISALTIEVVAVPEAADGT